MQTKYLYIYILLLPFEAPLVDMDITVLKALVK